jgi:signal transduction histidine kinase
MPAAIVLATADARLAAAWESQIPPGRIVIRVPAEGQGVTVPPGLTAVVVLDAASEAALPQSLVRSPTIFVGEPRSQPFEQARLSGRALVFLGYEESLSRLRDHLPLLDALAEKESMVHLLVDKGRRAEGGGSRPPMRVPAATGDSAELWDFLEAALESIDSRDRLLGEFRRASRHLLRASHAVFFLREPDGFRADRGTSFFGLDDPLVACLETHPIVIDGTNWDGPADPVAELAVRNRMALWGARLLVPIHDNARLLGLIALGVRDDGQPYDDADRVRAVCVARLLRQFLTRVSQLGRLQSFANQAAVGAKYLPGTLVLDSGEPVPRHVPLPVRDLIGRVRRTREVMRLAPTEGQPFRAGAGIVTETGGVWAWWEEASGEVDDSRIRRRAERLGLLKELALTLGHEIGNPLVSLSTFRQAPDPAGLPPSMLETIRRDIASIESLARQIASMQALGEPVSESVDARELVKAVGSARSLRVDVGPEAMPLRIAGDLLETALGALVDTLSENRKHRDAAPLSLQLRSTGAGNDLTALLSVRGKNLELEGILPEPVPGAVPNQGRLGVFLAKEVIRLHHGEIHAGPGLEGTEILISFRSL